MDILGLHSVSHSAAACLIRDGEILAAAEEERFDRIKHSGAFPLNAIRFCLDTARTDLSSVSGIAVAYDPMKVAAYSIVHALAWNGIAQPSEVVRTIRDEWHTLDGVLGARRWLRNGDARLRVQYVSHHLAHAASSFLFSPFNTASILTLDGYGEHTSTMFACGTGKTIRPLGSVSFPSSLGLLYNALTEFLGFRPDAEEGTVMGLAAYGHPEYSELFRRIVRPTPAGFSSDVSYLGHSGQHATAKLRHVLGPPREPGSPVTQREMNIAASLQQTTEEVSIHLARLLHQQDPRDDLCLAGGVALNCVMNGKLLEHTPFKRIFVPPAPGDAGTAMGAAGLLWYRLSGASRLECSPTSFLGPSYDDASVLDAITKAKTPHRRCDDPVAVAADLLHRGQVIGWFQGRMEFGPRALGNRSILASPCVPTMTDFINTRVKFRETFRPLAPAVTEEDASDFFRTLGPSPFMNMSYIVHPEVRAAIPAVVHADGSARVQTVSQNENPQFWQLLKSFQARSGVPVLLNTSFNIRGEPIVNTPSEAVQSYLQTPIDSLIIGNYLLSK